MKVNFLMIEEDTPEGKRYGAQCGSCPEKFFDRMSAGKRPRVLESGIEKAIAHANTVHQSTGGIFGVNPNTVILNGCSATSIVDTPFRKVEVLQELDGHITLRATEFSDSRAAVSIIHLKPHEVPRLAQVLTGLDDAHEVFPRRLS